MEGKVAKIVHIARAGARVHGCFRDAFTSDAAGLGGGEREREGRGVHIVLVLIYAAHPAFLLPRYRDLSAANYTFTPFLAPSTLEHRKTRPILLLLLILLPGLSPPPQSRKHVRVYPFLLAPHLLLFIWLPSFFRAVAIYT